MTRDQSPAQRVCLPLPITFLILRRPSIGRSDSKNSFLDLQFKFALNAHRAAVNAISIHGSFIVSTSGDHSIILWDANTGEPLRTFANHHTRGFVNSPYPLKFWTFSLMSSFFIPATPAGNCSSTATLPAVRASIPSIEAFPLFQLYLYVKDPEALRAAFGVGALHR